MSELHSKKDYEVHLLSLMNIELLSLVRGSTVNQVVKLDYKND